MRCRRTPSMSCAGALPGRSRPGSTRARRSNPEDDLSLAVVLKSPLFGLTDDDLFEIAYERRTSLWNVLQAKAKENARFKEPADTLSHWLSRVDLAPPYEFFLELLGE